MKFCCLLCGSLLLLLLLLLLVSVAAQSHHEPAVDFAQFINGKLLFASLATAPSSALGRLSIGLIDQFLLTRADWNLS